MKTSSKFYLDKNENCFLHHPSVEQAITKNSHDSINKYPPAHNLELYQALSQFHSLSEEYLYIDNGLENIIRVLWLSLKHKFDLDNLVLPEICWSAYHEIAKKTFFAKEKFIFYPTNKITFKNDLSQLDKALTNVSKPSLIVINNPNNPTGQELDINHLDDIIKKYPQHLFFVDEAYIGFGNENLQNSHSLELVNKYSNILVGRSFSKFFLAPGIRLGYLVAQPQTLQALGLTPTYLGINPTSHNLGLKLIKEFNYYQKQAQNIKKIRNSFIKQINQTSSLFAYPSSTNFILVKVNHPTDLKQLQQYLEGNNFYIKYIPDIFGQQHLRITVAPSKVLDQLLSLLKSFFTN
jgi:histidinol-phosphate aminotransferase